MSLWIGDKEVGLAPGQTSGDVGGTYVIRDPSSDISKPYIEATDIQTIKEPDGKIKVTVNGQTFYANPGEIPEIGSYKPETGYTSTQRLTKEDIEYADEQLRQMGLFQAEQAKLKKQIENLTSQGYKPYVTIEGTTLYTKTARPNEVYVPRFGKMIPAEEYWSKYPTPIMKAEKEFSEYEQKVSKRLGLDEIITPAIKLTKHAKFLEEYDPKYQKYATKKTALREAMSDYAIGFVKGIRDKPLSSAANVAIAILVTKGAGALVAKVPSLATGIGVGKIASKINVVNALGAGLAGMYVYDVSQRYVAAPNKAEFLGALTSTELAPFAAGGYIGSRPIKPTLDIFYKQTSRQAAITKINIESTLKRQYKQQSRSLEEFIRSDEAQAFPKKKRYRQELVQILKPKELETVQEVEVIRADIALARQLIEEKYAVSQRAKPMMRVKEQKAISIQKSKMVLIPAMISNQLPITVQNNISKAITLLKSEAITRTVTVQEPVAIQNAVAIVKAIALQKAIAIQKQKTVQELKKVLKTKTKQKIIEELLRRKLPPLKVSKYSQEISRIAKKRKNRGKYIWDVNNPVPTLETLIG